MAGESLMSLFDEDGDDDIADGDADGDDTAENDDEVDDDKDCFKGVVVATFLVYDPHQEDQGGEKGGDNYFYSLGDNDVHPHQSRYDHNDCVSED